MNEIDWFKMTERPEERALRRKLRRRALFEWIGGILLAIIAVVFSWICIAALPPQSSAINDLEAGDWPSAARPSGLEANR